MVDPQSSFLGDYNELLVNEELPFTGNVENFAQAEKYYQYLFERHVLDFLKHMQKRGDNPQTVSYHSEEETKGETVRVDSREIDGFFKQLNELRETKFELVVIGNTNVGKSTFLQALTEMKGLFNTSNVRETSCIWRFKINNNQQVPFVINEFEGDS